MNYLLKMKGTTKSPPGVGFSEMAWSWIGAFVGIAAVGFVHSWIVRETDLIMIIGSFGASAVLVYGAIKSPLAQPRNLLGGHILSALIGVMSFNLLHDWTWLAGACAVATALVVMQATRTLHPPGGATALIAVIGSEDIHRLGYLYAIVPAGLGALMMLLVALLVNNIPRRRRYPEFWF